MISNEEAKMLLKFRGVSGLSLKVVLAHEGGPTVLLTRDDEKSPWMMASPAFGELFDDILKPFVGKYDEGILIKQEIQSAVYNTILKSCKPYIDSDLDKIKKSIDFIEEKLVANINEELLDLMRNVSSKVISPTLESPFLDEPQFAEEKKNLEKYKQALAVTYPAGVRRYKKVLEFMNSTESKIEKSANLNENNKKVLLNFQQNIEVFRTKVKIKDAEKLPETFNPIESAKTLFSQVFEESEQIIGAIR